jgi:hypothetical protein
MSKKIGLIYLVICFSFAILVVIPTFKESGFGFLQTSNTLNSTYATAANSTNATAANSTQIPKSVQITTSDTKAATNGTSVDIDLQIHPFPVTKNVDTQFKITFLQASTKSVQVHVDWNFVISKMNKVIYNTADIYGQPIQHTAEGIVSPSYKFEEGGEYLLQISVVGVNFIPITTEQALFELKVS